MPDETGNESLSREPKPSFEVLTSPQKGGNEFGYLKNNIFRFWQELEDAMRDSVKRNGPIAQEAHMMHAAVSLVTELPHLQLPTGGRPASDFECIYRPQGYEDELKISWKSEKGVFEVKWMSEEVGRTYPTYEPVEIVKAHPEAPEIVAFARALAEARGGERL